ncbi:MAG: hypothetical protein M5U14_06390 [Acidimicrobiia bacterium]|nr:hypothetical protein [Acidimicrobiia bacterium]
MSVALGIVTGLLAARFLVLSGGDVLRTGALQRENYRGHRLPTAGGVIVVLALLVVEAGRASAGALGVGEESGLTEARALVLFACLGFGLLGLLDDLLGEGEERGFRGHVAALVQGRVTTGALKAFGGVGVAVILVATPGFVGGRRIVVDAVIIALAANLGNLLDRAPGRTVKVALAAYVPLAVVAGTGPVGVALAPVMGATAGLLGDDLRERLMLGDTGANVIGGVVGLGAVLVLGDGARLVVLVGLLALNLLSEVVSFSRVIEGVAPLRALDLLGRRRPPRWRGRSPA